MLYIFGCPVVEVREMAGPGREYSFAVQAQSAAEPARVFAKVTDGPGWSQWAGPLIVTSEWERYGTPVPGGVGSIRRIGLRPVLVREQTVEYEQDRRHVYKMLSGAPVRDYQAEVVLAPADDGGTKITWQGRFTEQIPRSGPLLRFMLNRMIASFAKRLARSAEQDEPTD
jgi:hypothetical protein